MVFFIWEIQQQKLTFNNKNMELNVFIQNFADQFEDTDIDSFCETTKFRELEEWSSMIALSVMAMVDEEYDIQLKADEMRSAETIGQLFEIVKGKAE